MSAFGDKKSGTYLAYSKLLGSLVLTANGGTTSAASSPLFRNVYPEKIIINIRGCGNSSVSGESAILRVTVLSIPTGQASPNSNVSYVGYCDIPLPSPASTGRPAIITLYQSGNIPTQVNNVDASLFNFGSITNPVDFDGLPILPITALSSRDLLSASAVVHIPQSFRLMFQCMDAVNSITLNRVDIFFG